MRKYELIENFFENIDSEEKAYFLGLLYADGYVNENLGMVDLTLHHQDKQILDDFVTYLYPNNDRPLKLIRNKYYRLVINSKKLVSDLKTHGCIQKKTFKIVFPEISNNLLNHFIRGYFDGDGSVWIQKEVLNISIVGTINFLQTIKKILIENCNLNETKLDNRHPERKNNIRALRYGGNIIINRIYHYLYDNATIYLNRKHVKFLAILKDKEYFCDSTYKRKNHQKWFVYDGKKFNKSELARVLSKETNILASTIRRRLNNGWSVDEITHTTLNQRRIKT